MSPNIWPLLEPVSTLLDPEERQQVLGDIQERGSDVRALFDLIGLVLLRQLQSWLTWQPWLLTAVLAIPIMWASSATHPLALVAYSGHFLSFEHGSGTFLVRPWTALPAPAFAWAAGLALGRIGSRRTASVLLLLIVVTSFTASTTANRVFQIELPPLWKSMFQIVPTMDQQLSYSIRMLGESLRFGISVGVMILSVALPSVHGWYRGQQGRPVASGLAIAIVAMALLTDAPLFVFGWRWQSMLRFLVACWPLAYLTLSSTWRDRRSSAVISG